jgi:hypothetical protein
VKLRSGPGRLRWLAFAAASVAVLAWEVYAIFLAEYGTPYSKPAHARFMATEVAGEVAVSQTMALLAAGFDAVVVHARPYGKKVSGEVVFELTELAQGGGRPVFRTARPAAEVAASDSYTVRFAPIEQSEYRQYSLRITAPDAAPGEGITLLASREDAYPQGALFIGGREQWGDLVFETSASRSTIFSGVEYLLRSKPPFLRSRWVLGGVFALFNWALLTFLYSMAFAADEQARGGRRFSPRRGEG